MRSDPSTGTQFLHFQFAQSLLHRDQEVELVVGLGEEAVKGRTRSPHEVQQHEQLDVLQLRLFMSVAPSMTAHATHLAIHARGLSHLCSQVSRAIAARVS